MKIYAFVPIVLIFLLALFEFLNAWGLHRQKARGQIVFSRLPHETLGQSKWQVVEPYTWTKKSFPEKKPSVFRDNPMALVSAFAMVGSFISLTQADTLSIWGCIFATASFLLVCKSHRFSHELYTFALATLCSSKTQTWVQDAVLAQSPEVAEGNIVILQGSPE